MLLAPPRSVFPSETCIAHLASPSLSLRLSWSRASLLHGPVLVRTPTCRIRPRNLDPVERGHRLRRLRYPSIVGQDLGRHRWRVSYSGAMGRLVTIHAVHETFCNGAETQRNRNGATSCMPALKIKEWFSYAGGKRAQDGYEDIDRRRNSTGSDGRSNARGRKRAPLPGRPQGHPPDETPRYRHHGGPKEALQDPLQLPRAPLSRRPNFVQCAWPAIRPGQMPEQVVASSRGSAAPTS